VGAKSIMTPTPESRLLELYDRVAEAPGAIDRLRKFVLDLAVRGKLVEQNPEDEPAEELLERITAEKARMVKASEIRKPRAVPSLNTEDISYPAPEGWTWTQIVQIGVISPRNEADDDLDASFVPMPMIAAELGVPHQHEVRCWGEIKKGYTHFAEGDVGLAKITPCFENGKSAVFRNLTGGIGAGTTELHIVRPIFADPDYVLLFLKSPQFIETGIPRMTGTAGQKRVPSEYFTSSPFPLPPLPEQHRIVAKVDELMNLLDRLETTRTQQETTRDRLSTASLARLTEPETTENELRAHVLFALGNLDHLTSRPEQIKVLRQTILDLAVRGKLQPGASSEIRTVGKFRKLQNGYAFKSTWFSKSGIRLLRNANIGHGEVRWNDVVYFPTERAEEFERFRLSEGDIVLALDRPFIVTGTKVARIKKADLPSLLLQRVGRFVETVQGLSDDYLFLWVNSPHFNEQIDPGRSNGVPHISSKQVETAEIYVPPLAEQRRIVAKVDALMALCDRLEAALRSANTACAGLLEAAVHKSLGASCSEQEAA